MRIFAGAVFRFSVVVLSGLWDGLFAFEIGNSASVTRSNGRSGSLSLARDRPFAQVDAPRWTIRNRLKARACQRLTAWAFSKPLTQNRVDSRLRQSAFGNSATEGRFL